MQNDSKYSCLGSIVWMIGSGIMQRTIWWKKIKDPANQMCRCVLVWIKTNLSGLVVSIIDRSLLWFVLWIAIHNIDRSSFVCVEDSSTSVYFQVCVCWSHRPTCGLAVVVMSIPFQNQTVSVHCEELFGLDYSQQVLYKFILEGVYVLAFALSVFQLVRIQTRDPYKALTPQKLFHILIAIVNLSTMLARIWSQFISSCL